jgi:hypothetical protein
LEIKLPALRPEKPLRNRSVRKISTLNSRGSLTVVAPETDPDWSAATNA